MLGCEARNSNLDASLSNREVLNQKLLGKRIRDLYALLPMEKLLEAYPFIQDLPETTPVFDLLLEDDRRMFPELA